MDEALIADLLRRETGAEAQAVMTLVGGQVGRVFRVDAADRSFVIKFVRAQPEPSFADEPIDNRVYGSRWSNLTPAYERMKASGVATPTLLASGFLTNQGLNYAILDYLDGDPDDHSDAWFSALGRSLGVLHRITRPYQGWIGMDQPLDAPWTAAFAQSLRSRIEAAWPVIGETRAAAISRLAEAMLPGLTEPAAFVLSHTDGFQGVFKRTADHWTLLGAIDIEDYQFTDQRFVLAGLELSHACEGRTVPQAFWDSYLATATLDPSYDQRRLLFQLYYLAVWTRVVADQPALFATCLRQLDRLLG